MKILLLQNMLYVPAWGGANKGNKILLEGLASRNHSCQVVAPIFGSHGLGTRDAFLALLADQQLPVLSSTPSAVSFLCNQVEVHAVEERRALAAYAAAQIKTFQPDCIVVSSQDPGQALLKAALDSAAAPVFCLVHAARDMPFGAEAFYESALNTSLFHRVAGVVSVSRFLRDYLWEKGKVESTVINLPAYGPGPFPVIGNFDNEFVTLVNPSEIKGISIFLALAKRFPEVAFAAVSSWATTGADRKKLEALPNIRILEAVDDIDDVFRRTRILLVPSLWSEAFGLIAVEAMLRGIPTLAADIGGLPEAKLGVDYVLPIQPIKHYEKRFDERGNPLPVVPEQDIEPWALALEALLKNRTRYESLAAASRKAALAFVEQTGVEPFERFFQAPLKKENSDNKKARRASASLVSDSSPVEQISTERRALLALRVLRNKQKAQAATPAQTITRAERHGQCGIFPLSFAQERLWLVDQLEPGTSAYNLSGMIWIRGALDENAVAQSIQEIVRRHEILRTTFELRDGNPVQVIHPESDVELEVIRLDDVAEDQGEIRVNELADAHARTPFELTRGPLLRVKLVRLNSVEHVIIFAMHHIVSDGWSMGVLVREFKELYGAYAAGRPSSLEELPIQYVDFAVWQRGWLQGEVLEKQLSYWKKRLAEAPVLELPTDRPRPVVQSYRGAAEKVEIGLELMTGLKELSRSQGVTLFMTLSGAFKVLLSRYSGQRDIVVGTPIANRRRGETEGLIGFFVNTLVMRTELSSGLTVRELLVREREVAMEAYEHQDVPFERLVAELQVERDLSRNPLFQVMFALQNAPGEKLGVAGLEFKAVEVNSATAKFDLFLSLGEGEKGLRGTLEYSTDLFERATVAGMMEHWQRVLEAMVGNPEGRCDEIELLSEGERGQLAGWNETGFEYARGKSVPEVIEEQGRRQAGTVAVECGLERLTYGELNERAEAVAGVLRRMGVGAEVLVGVYVERSVEMVAGLLGIWKAGGAYIPMDPNYPQERLAYVVKQAGVKVLLTQVRLKERLEQIVSEAGVGGVEMVCLDELRAEEARENGSRAGVEAGNLAYVIYTSGSTGRPKGVQVSHGALMNFVEWMKQEPGMGREDRLLAVTTLSFDIAGLELWLPLSSGARVVIVGSEAAMDGKELARLLEEKEVTVMQATPVTWRLLLDGGWAGKKDLKVLCGGEAWAKELAEKLVERSGSVWNMYGPTETTIWSAASEVKRGEVPKVGRPIGNTQIYVLDEQMKQVPAGVAGELFIGGEGLGRGYLHRAELTAEKFVPDAHGKEAGQRLYRTGDWCRQRADGQIEFIGRRDQQVKIRGYRIELGEIEARLAEHPAIKTCAVIDRKDENGETFLAAYIVASQTDPDFITELRMYLRQHLSAAMVPSVFVSLDKLPLTGNGKLDRRSLPTPVTSSEPRVTVSSASNPTVEIMGGIWADILKRNAVELEEDFFSIGGHSLLATKLILRIRERFGVELPLKELFETPTVIGLSRKIEESLGKQSGVSAPPIVIVEPGEELPLSYAQERLWFLDQVEPGTPIYNLGGAIQAQGALRIEILEQALNEIIQRHAVLRTTFSAVDGLPRQVVNSSWLAKLDIVDLSGLSGADQARLASQLAREEMQRPFCLERDLMLRFKVLRLTETNHVILYTLHHIASDGWSIGILVQEFVAFYSAFLAGQPSPLPPLPIQYADFAVWQRKWLQGAVLENHLAYWKEQLGSKRPAVLQLADSPLSDGGFLRAERPINCSRRLTEQLHQLSRAEGITLFMTLLTAFKALLARYTGEKRIAVGTFVANRTRTETESLIGFFVNHLMLNTDLSGDVSFVELLRRVRSVTLGAYAHQDLPFQKLVAELQPERSAIHSPLYRVMFALHNIHVPDLTLPDLILRPLRPELRVGPLDLYVSFSETKDGLTGTFEYDPGLFREETIELLVENYLTLLEQLVANPIGRVAEWRPTEKFETAVNARRSAHRKPKIVLTATFPAGAVGEPLGFWMDELGLQMEVTVAPCDGGFQELLSVADHQDHNEGGVSIVLVRAEDFRRDQFISTAAIQEQVHHFIAAVKRSANCSFVVGLCPSGIRPDDSITEIEALIATELKDVKGVHLIQSSEWAQHYPELEIFDPQSNAHAEISHTPEFFTVVGTVLARKISSFLNDPFKVIVLDCDQTLWTGTCAEDGASGITIDPGRQALQEWMLKKKNAGWLLCLCSKNNETDVAEVFRRRQDMPLKWEDFISRRINWEPKSKNLKSLSQELGVGLDSFVFIDDNPLECAEVEINCPSVAALLLPDHSEKIGSFLRNVWLFDRLGTTLEDVRRTEFYQQDHQRAQFRMQSPSLAAFLASLNLKVSLTWLDEGSLARVAQLTQRTNQFNTTTIRRTEGELAGLLDRKELECLVATVEDRFGDYGLTGVVLFRSGSKAITVDTFLLSCRILGKGIEHQMLARIGHIAEERGIEFVRVPARLTGKNQPAMAFLESLSGAHKESMEEGPVFQWAASALTKLVYEPAGGQPSSSPPERPSVAYRQRTRPTVWRRIAHELSQTSQIQQAYEAKRPVVQPNGNAEFVAPRTPTEKTLATIWQEVLKMQRISVYDNFFGLGGHSLLATQVIARSREAFQIDIPLRIIFSTNFTIAGLAGIIVQQQMEKIGAQDMTSLLQEIDGLSDEQARALTASHENQ